MEFNEKVEDSQLSSSKQRAALQDFDVIESESDEEIGYEELATRIGIFTCFWASNMFGNLDTGVIPTTLHLIMAELQITQGETAFLISVQFLACGVGSILVAPLMRAYPAKNVLISAQLLNAASTLLFLYSTSYWYLLGARIVQGFSYAFFSTYGPVWINVFAPKKMATQWLSWAQSLSMIGIIIGYMVGSLAADAELFGIKEYFNWRRAIFTQGIALFIISFFFMRYPNEKLDILAEEKGLVESRQSGRARTESQNFAESHFGSDVLALVCNPVYISTMLVICSMYFSSTGLQFWTIQYMQTILGARPLQAQFLFILSAATAPIPGALIGSYISDRAGGYKGKFQLQALIICCGFALLASVAGIATFFLYEIYSFTVGLWLLLAFGAALFPTCYGIIISSVRKEQQSASSAFGQIFFNLAGFFLAPNVSGYVMDQYSNPKEGLLMGYRLVLAWNVFTLMFLFFSVAFSYREYKAKYAVASSADPVMIRPATEEDSEM